MCILLSTDAFYRAYQLRQPNTIARRDHQVKIDICIDFLCVAAPLCVLWFVYHIPISIPEMIQITVWPALCLFSKLRSILREIIRVRTDNAILLEQTRISKEKGSNRKMLFRLSSSVKSSMQQQERMPKIVSTGFSKYNIVYGLFFLAVAIAHLAMRPIGCDNTTWARGCVDKIPFCKSLFTPTCNCASLRIENDYGLTALPDELVDDMGDLRKVFIRNCNLTALPPRMETLTAMVDFEVSFNRLKRFDVDVGKWERLEALFLNKNNITVNNDAIFTHDNLAYLELSDNTGLDIPRTQGKVFMPSLLQLALANNSVEIDATFDNKMFPSLLDLFLSDNTLKVFPDQTLQHSLQYLGVARCRLQKVPAYLKEFRYLKYLDVRNNNISTVPEEIKALVKQNEVESYFADNPVCRVDESLDCEPLCSKYCWIRDEPGNGFCDFRCNSKVCQNDGGDCE